MKLSRFAFKRGANELSGYGRGSAQASKTIFLVMSKAAADKLIADGVKIGAEAGIAVANMGAGVEGSTTTNVGADILAYSRSQGLYGGFNFEGAAVVPDKDANAAYYGREVKPVDIVGTPSIANSQADSLRTALGG